MPSNQLLYVVNSVITFSILLMLFSSPAKLPNGRCPPVPAKNCGEYKVCPTLDGRDRYGFTQYGHMDQSDDYFMKNLQSYLDWDIDKDIVSIVLKRLNRPFKRILDYGPAYASRMHQLCQDWNCELGVGVEPSLKAIQRNRIDFPQFKFFLGSMDDHQPLPKEWDHSFDLVISSYTIDIVHRDHFFKALQNVHQYIAKNGVFIIHVFAPHNHCIERRGNRKGQTVILDYQKIFEATGLYRVLYDQRLDYDTQRQYMGGHTVRKDGANDARVVVLQRMGNNELVVSPFGGERTHKTYDDLDEDKDD
eukprot:TRINITY_DN4470_c0_g1_i2.p1 TRINITY_DN4470_c0_g1~~TRINITY_DN4470_c0_g1_i2.p1  ORF type:complete len:333 (-),score=57.78 TRINITY_DN4470_c0_g1_i2:72-986(-)